MAPQTSIPLAANVLGTIGTVFWCIQLIPQAWYNWRRKSTEGLPLLMMLIWTASAIPFGVYAIVQNFTIAIQVQPQVFGALAVVNVGQILFYTHKWSLWRTSLAFAFLIILAAGIEALLIFTLRGPTNAGDDTPMLVIGVIAVILIAAGLLPPYWEIWKRNGRVQGISYLFLATDSLGALFSLLALVAQNTWDALGGVVYVVVIAEELGIFLLALIWRIRTWSLHRKAKEAGIDFDDLPEARKWQDHSRKRASVAPESSPG